MSHKIVNVAQLEADLASVADSIRAKSGKSGSLAFPSGFKSAVDSIAKSEVKNQDITIKQNGTYNPPSGYTGFGTVKVETEVVKNQNITIKENGTFTPDSGFSGFGSVTVEVEGSLPPGVGIYYIGTASSTLELDFESSAIGSLT